MCLAPPIRLQILLLLKDRTVFGSIQTLLYPKYSKVFGVQSPCGRYGARANGAAHLAFGLQQEPQRVLLLVRLLAKGFLLPFHLFETDSEGFGI